MSDDARRHMQATLDKLGFAGDPEMAETAARFTQFLSEWLPIERTETPVSVCATSTPDQVVAFTEIPFHSLCAHHLLPFHGTVDVAYRTGDVLLGLGSLPRLVRQIAQRPQLQERMAQQLLDALVEAVGDQDVLVRIRARHMCVEMRGSRSPGHAVVLVSHGNTKGLMDALSTSGEPA